MKSGPLCILACQWCNLPEFWEWAKNTTHCGDRWQVKNAKEAKVFIKELCCVETRKDLDTDVLAGRVFHACIRQPFMVWQAEKAAA